MFCTFWDAVHADLHVCAQLIVTAVPCWVVVLAASRRHPVALLPQIGWQMAPAGASAWLLAYTACVLLAIGC